MNFIHFIDSSTLDLVRAKGILVNECYRGKGILVYPDRDINFKTFSSEAEQLLNEEKLNELSNDQKWEIIGSLGLKQNGKIVLPVKVRLSDFHWPIKVFIDIHDQVAERFAELLKGNKGIRYDSIYSLSQVINNIKSKNFMIEGKFTVASEVDLTNLVSYFLQSNGGIWGAHSLDCMIESDIQPNFIL